MPKKNHGKFIVFEGLDGSGITTQARRLCKHLEQKIFIVNTSEPTQGPMGLLLRLMLSERLSLGAKMPKLEEMANGATALLFAADRLDHLQHLIIPKLEEGYTVVCERYHLSSFAYQMGKDVKNLDWLTAINAKCVIPDLVIFLDTPLDICEQRRSRRWSQELYEKREILKQVHYNYQYVIEQLRGMMPIEIIDGTPNEEDVFQKVMQIVQQKFPELTKFSQESPSL